MVGKKKVLIAATLVAVGVMVIGGVALAADTMLEATLSGANEVDGQGNPNQGDPDGSGEATVNLMPRKEKVCYTLTVRDIAPAQAAHIHKGSAGVNGPIVKELKAPTDTDDADTVGSSEGCARLSRKKIRMIKNNPAGYYVNVHNGEFPNGALRGQLEPAGP
jgi:hypothetical protein